MTSQAEPRTQDYQHLGRPGNLGEHYRLMPVCPVLGMVRMTDNPKKVSCPNCQSIMSQAGQEGPQE